MLKYLLLAAMLVPAMLFAQVPANQMPTGYCSIYGSVKNDVPPLYAQDNPGYVYISNVQLGSINNTSGFTPGGYADYTNLSTDLILGKQYTIKVFFSQRFNNSAIQVWLDESRIGNFNAFEGGAAESGTPITFTVGANQLGKSRLRIIYGEVYNSKGQSNSYNSCGRLMGEAEDYAVNFINCPKLTISPSANFTTCAGTNFKLTASGADNYTWIAGNFGPTGTGPVLVASTSVTRAFYVEATSNNGCPPASASITANIVNIDFTPTGTVNSGATLDPNSGWGKYNPTFIWRKAGNPATLSNNSYYTACELGTYFLQAYIPALGCTTSSTTSMSIRVKTPPTPVFTTPAYTMSPACQSSSNIVTASIKPIPGIDYYLWRVYDSPNSTSWTNIAQYREKSLLILWVGRRRSLGYLR